MTPMSPTRIAAQRRGPTRSRSMGTESALISRGLTKVMATASAKGSSRRQATKVTAVAALVMLRSTCQPIRRVPRVRSPPWAIASAIAKKGAGMRVKNMIWASE